MSDHVKLELSEFHIEIIGAAEAKEDGNLHFTAEGSRRLLTRFCEVLETPDFPRAVDGFVRAVAAFQAGEQADAAAQLMDIGTQAVETLRSKNAPAADKLRSSITGAADPSKMRPSKPGEVPEGAVKATAFIRPPPKQRG
ncbi:MAG: hypothetical protein AAFN74_01145 [Myxococcota bacterium]